VWCQALLLLLLLPLLPPYVAAAAAAAAAAAPVVVLARVPVTNTTNSSCHSQSYQLIDAAQPQRQQAQQ
jgi:hypothetical protein